MWETDIKYGWIEGEERFFFVCSIIDYHIGLRCSEQDISRVLHRALGKRQQFNQLEKPLIRSDNGPQFVSHAFEETCKKFNMEHERIPPKTPNMNAHFESFHRVLEEDCFRRFQFQTYEEAYKEVAWFIKFYNERRMQSSPFDLAPNEFYEKRKTESLEIKEVRV